MNFSGKVILISGATGGMGAEVAKLLAKEGAKLALFARREDMLKEMTEQISTDKDQCIYKKCDVTKIDDIKEAVKYTVEKFGRIDLAILTAGILVPNPIQTFDASIIKKTIDVNFMGNVYFIEQIMPIMKKQKDGIIAVTSTLPDRRGWPGWGAYGASKAAISWLIESLRAEGKKRYNIDFITIKPGSVETPMIDGYDRKGSITSEEAAVKILNGIRKRKKIIQFPFYQVALIRLMDKFPPAAYDSFDVEMMKGDGYPEVEEE